MYTAKIFTNDGSQAVQLPQDCRFEDDEVFVHKIGDAVILFPKGSRWQNMLNSLPYFTKDYLAEETGIE